MRVAGGSLIETEGVFSSDSKFAIQLNLSHAQVFMHTLWKWSSYCLQLDRGIASKVMWAFQASHWSLLEPSKLVSGSPFILSFDLQVWSVSLDSKLMLWDVSEGTKLFEIVLEGKPLCLLSQCTSILFPCVGTSNDYGSTLIFLLSLTLRPLAARL